QQLFKSLYDKHILSKISPEKTPKIPKISHMIWFGNEFPARFHLERELFMKEHKEWVHILWVDNPKNYIFGNIIENPDDIVHLVNDSTLQGKSFIIDIKNFKLHNQQFFDKAVKNVEKSDIARYEIIYTYGGVFIEPDYRALKPFDILNHCYDFFIGIMNNENSLVLSSAVFGSVVGHPILKHCIETIIDDHKFINTELKTGSLHLTKSFIAQVEKSPGIAI